MKHSTVAASRAVKNCPVHVYSCRNECVHLWRWVCASAAMAVYICSDGCVHLQRWVCTSAAMARCAPTYTALAIASSFSYWRTSTFFLNWSTENTEKWRFTIQQFHQSTGTDSALLTTWIGTTLSTFHSPSWYVFLVVFILQWLSTFSQCIIQGHSFQHNKNTFLLTSAVCASFSVICSSRLFASLVSICSWTFSRWSYFRISALKKSQISSLSWTSRSFSFNS